MFTHPEVQYHSVEPVAGREGLVGLSTADFRRLNRVDPDPCGWIPYCIDESEVRLVCATGLDARTVAERGLHYAQLRSMTTQIATIPTALVPSVATLPLERIYVFSPGRCGSTLLCQLLRSAGIPAFAEPGFYLPCLQRARGASASNRTLLTDRLAKLEYLLLQPFDHSATAVIKPNPYCSGDLELFLGTSPATPRVRSIALLRRIQPWSCSWGAFNQTLVEQDIAIYIQYLKQLEKLIQRTDCLVVNYEDIIASPKNVVSLIGRHLTVDVDLSGIDASMGIDSHAGDRAWKGSASADDPIREILVNALWQLRRPDELIERLDIRSQTG